MPKLFHPHRRDGEAYPCDAAGDLTSNDNAVCVANDNTVCAADDARHMLVPDM
jgi:hypothetical protein